MEFEIGDLVDVDGRIDEVTGVIHYEERLFITPFYGGQEREVPFSKVNNLWRKLNFAQHAKPAIPAPLIEIIGKLIELYGPEEQHWMYAKLEQVQQASAQ